MKNLAESYRTNGLTPRTHGNSHRLPKRTLSYESIREFVVFLQNYVEQHGLLLPGRVPGYSRSDIKLLPSSVSKRGIWRVYRDAMLVVGSRSAAYTTFCRLWKQLLPSVVLMKPMSDLCWQCQQNSTAILRAANFPESEKSATILAAQEHLKLVQLERSFYKTTCDECRRSIREFFTEDDVFKPPPLASNPPPNSLPIKVHYSFDYAQQVHFPSDPLQPGPLYFLTPRKCAIFGVNCEALPRQVNFLCDESGDCGKGANTVVSQLHYFLENHGMGEQDVYLHADNCTGQNKNNCMIQYLLWRVLTQRHTNITMSFLVVGHTKFAPDWCFGLFKRLYRRTRIGSLQTIAEVVEKSAECNAAQLVVEDDGRVIVPTYNWTDFFATRFKKIPGIKKLHHFRFPSTECGVVYTKLQSDGKETKVKLLKDPSAEVDVNELPSVVQPKGLSTERQWYLHDQIREFCPENDRDVTCPLPSVPRPVSRQNTPEPPQSPEVPQPKRRRVCGSCREVGHNSRTCPNK